MYLTRHKIR